MMASPRPAAPASGQGSRTSLTDPEPAEGLLPPRLIGTTALVAGLVLVAVSLLGPLGWGTIQYPTSQSAVWQVQAQDLVDLVLLAPLLLIGGAFDLLGRPVAKYLLILPPLSLFYTALTYGVGEEWGNPAYAGNSYRFAPLFLVLMVASVLITVGTLSRFHRSDAPPLARRPLRIYAAITIPFLAIFALLWLLQVVQVGATGSLPDGTYTAAPTSFWMVRFLDLGVTIPLGLLTISLLLSQPARAYGLALLFVGYFVTLGTAVVAMGALLAYHHDPSVSGGNSVQLVVFGVLAGIAYWLLYYLVRPKFTEWGVLARPSPGRPAERSVARS